MSSEIEKIETAAAVVKHGGRTHVIFALPQEDGSFYSQKITQHEDGTWTDPIGYEDGFNKSSATGAVAAHVIYLESVILNT